MRPIKLGISLMFFLFIFVLVTGTTTRLETIEIMDATDLELMDETVNIVNLNEIASSDFLVREDQSIYENDSDSQVYKLYVTVLPPPDLDKVTFDEVNTYVKQEDTDYSLDAFDKQANIIFSTSEHSISPAESIPNGTIELRGQTSRGHDQKSYKIKLHSNTQGWDGFYTLNLNKSLPDEYRLKNKLSYDLFETIPEIVSLRTRFVQLHVKDLSTGAGKTNYENYGLFTFIEQPNKRFLERHGLDRNGHFYKAEFFEFFRYEDHLKSKDDITYSEEEFGQILEIRGSDDHEKLLKMLDDLNDYSQDIDTVIDKHFDKDNLYAWLSLTILFNNYDTNARNFMLYSPLNSEKWYFVPWDYDGGWNLYRERVSWQYGLSNYWGMVLFNRMFKEPSNLQELNDKIIEYEAYLSPSRIKGLLSEYENAIYSNLFIMPDLENARIDEETFKEDYYKIADLPSKFKGLYFEGIEKPMPFFLGYPRVKEKQLVFSWDNAYDLQDDAVSYDFKLSKYPSMRNPIYTDSNLKVTEVKLPPMEDGIYYYYVKAIDANGNERLAFDKYYEGSNKYFGVQRFELGGEN